MHGQTPPQYYVLYLPAREPSAVQDYPEICLFLRVCTSPPSRPCQNSTPARTLATTAVATSTSSAHSVRTISIIHSRQGGLDPPRGTADKLVIFSRPRSMIRSHNLTKVRRHRSSLVEEIWSCTPSRTFRQTSTSASGIGPSVLSSTTCSRRSAAISRNDGCAGVGAPWSVQSLQRYREISCPVTPVQRTR